jgi:flagellin-specific chaperone FliS
MDIEKILEKEKSIALNVLKDYNIKYKTDEINKLNDILNYLYSCLETETNTEIKKILMEDINIIKEYL